MRCLLLAFAFASLIAAQHDTPDRDGGKSKKNPLGDSAEVVDAGRTQYVNSCSGCHGPTAEGGRGPRLAGNGDVRGASDESLFNVIKNGVRGSDMPPSPLPEEKIWQMVAYVRTLNARAYQTRVPGDREAGRATYMGKAGCVKCHRIRGEGGLLGPDLSNIGASRSVAQLRESILKPSERPTEGYDGVTVVLKSGKRIQGIAKDNTNYTIQVMDAQGQLHLLNKAELSEIVFRKGSLMPGDYRDRLSRQELQDVLAYLSRQALRTDAANKEDKQ
ncbi:MAG: c-type cytochrome [Bryobacterales bacterium]|nr:c-type cytochrome [Bryobacterales bacterium]